MVYGRFFYIKKRSWIEALMMVMTLYLLIYNVAQHRLRAALSAQKETLPNQFNKLITRPTLKWIFQLMGSINIVRFHDNNQQVSRSMITNLDD